MSTVSEVPPGPGSSAGAHVPVPAGRQGSSRRVLLAAVTAVLTALVAGVGVFSLQRSLTPAGLRDCGGFDYCLAGVDVEAVTAKLTSQAFFCQDASLTTLCELETPFRDYSVSLGLHSPTEADQITVRSFPMQGFAIDEKRTAALMTWVASLLYPDAPDEAAQVTAWLGDRLAARKSSSATLGSYRMDFTVGDHDDVTLRARGVRKWWR